MAAVLLVGAPGCALERAGIGGGRDGGRVPDPIDAGETRLDAGGPSDAGPTDAGDPGARDAGPPDPGAPDAGVDAGPPDAGVPPLCPDVPELVACYALDGDALDRGPRGNDLTATGITWLPDGGAQLRNASGLVAPYRSELDHSSTTILAWVRVDSIPPAGRAAILDRDGLFGIFVFPNGELRCSISSTTWAVAPAALRAGEWQHVACVAEGTTVQLYVGGARVATGSASPLTITTMPALNLGENGPAGDDQLNGALDDVRIFDAQWNAAKVLEDAMWGRRRG